MSREAKIIIFGIILLFSIYLKWCDRDKSESKRFDTSSYNTTPKNNSTNKKKPPAYNYDTKKNDKDPLELFEECEDTYLPKSGFSPYDSYFGKGRYDYSADNSIVVKTPSSSNIVFLLRNVYTGKTIRNEFIRKNSTFKLTNIPYGTYDFSYFSGKAWDSNILINNGKIKGGFTCSKSFSKSDDYKDRMEFEVGYYGSYELTLTAVIGGNLQTETIDEDEFFN